MGTAGWSVPTMLSGGSRERVLQGPTGQDKLVCIPISLGFGGAPNRVIAPLTQQTLQGRGDTVGKFSNKGVWVREGCGMGPGRAVPTREQIPFASKNPGKGQLFPNTLDMARCKQPLWPPPHWLQGLLGISLPHLKHGCSQYHQCPWGWGRSGCRTSCWSYLLSAEQGYSRMELQSCRDWEWVEGSRGEEGMGRAQGR